MRAFLLMLFALVVTLALSPVVWVAQHVRYPLIGRSLSRLYWDTAIGLDQLGGAILYGEPDWTVSSRTHWLAMKGNKAAALFERFIDMLFGKGHCASAYTNEILRGGAK